MRPMFLIPRILAIFVMAISCLAQTSPGSSARDAAANGAPSAASVPAAQTEADTDSADIPAMARGRISEEDYFALRDQQIRMQRGIDDLVRNPLQRTNAIRTMELQEFFLHQLRTGGAPLGALAPAATNTWAPLGPAPIPNGQTFGTFVDPTKEVPVSGRVTAIAIDPADATGNTVYVGTAQGGLYRTLDGGANWTPLIDAEPSLAIGAISIDPLDHTKVFVGTGEGNNSGDSFFGVGVFIILNATTTANVTGPFNSNGTSDIFTGRSVTQILVDPADDNKILVSTGSGFSGLSFDVFNNLPNRGVYLSTNALAASPTFTQLTIQTASANRIVSDMVIDPGNPAKVLVNVVGAGNAGDGGVWSSNSDPFTGTAAWTQQLILGGTGGVVGKFAVNRVGTTTTFALAASDSASCGTGTKAGTLRTSLDGATWTAVAGATGFCGGQCIYDAPVAMDPGNAHVIYVGGNGDSSTAAGLSCGTAALAKTTDGATFNRSDARLHPDSHAIAIVPSNSSIIYTGNDGGIFKSIDGGATWTSLNNATFSATQFQSLALHPKDANFMIGGTQDNGTELMNSAGTWTRSDAGDGGFALIDQSSPDTTNVTMYHTYFNQSGATTGQIGYARVTNIADATETGWSPFFGCPSTPTNGITANGINCNDNVLFYAPMALGPGTPNTLYFGTDHLYRSPDQGVTMTPVSQAPFAINPATGTPAQVSSIGISPQDDNVRIVGLVDGQVFATTTGANPMPEVTGPWGAHYVARAVIDPTNSSTAYVSLDGYGFPNHVWKTTNLNAATPTWTAASGGLQDVPVNSFVVDPVFPDSLFAGTDIGVFSSTDDGATWTPYGSGLPRVAVFDMAINQVSRKLRIATHGKGIWEIAIISPTGAVSLAADHVSIQTGTTVTLSASVAQGNAAAVPTGTITFNDGATPLGAAVTLNASATASLVTGPLTAGLHNITAAYSGDANFAASTSAVVVIDAGTPDYSVSIPNSSATISAGQSATINISVAPQHGFSSAITFSCSGLPASSSCSFNPASVTPSGSAASTTLTISTTSRALAASARPLRKPGAPLLATALFALCGVILLGTGKKRKWQSVTLMLCALALVGGMIACGGGNPPPPPQTQGTPAGTFSVVVTATSGNTSHTSTVTLTVR